MTYYFDYPKEKIGGGNPYYRCSACGLADPQINGALDGHRTSCSWRKEQEAKLAGATSEPILVWRFENAPEEYRKLSQHGGDEDWVAVIPAGEVRPYWTDSGSGFGCCDVSEHRLEDGRLVLIGAHA